MADDPPTPDTYFLISIDEALAPFFTTNTASIWPFSNLTIPQYIRLRKTVLDTRYVPNTMKTYGSIISTLGFISTVLLIGTLWKKSIKQRNNFYRAMIIIAFLDLIYNCLNLVYIYGFRKLRAEGHDSPCLMYVLLYSAGLCFGVSLASDVCAVILTFERYLAIALPQVHMNLGEKYLWKYLIRIGLICVVILTSLTRMHHPMGKRVIPAGSGYQPGWYVYTSSGFDETRFGMVLSMISDMILPFMLSALMLSLSIPFLIRVIKRRRRKARRVQPTQSGSGHSVIGGGGHVVIEVAPASSGVNSGQAMSGPDLTIDHIGSSVGLTTGQSSSQLVLASGSPKLDTDHCGAPVLATGQSIGSNLTTGHLMSSKLVTAQSASSTVDSGVLTLTTGHSTEYLTPSKVVPGQSTAPVLTTGHSAGSMLLTVGQLTPPKLTSGHSSITSTLTTQHSMAPMLTIGHSVTSPAARLSPAKAKKPTDQRSIIILTLSLDALFLLNQLGYCAYCIASVKLTQQDLTYSSTYDQIEQWIYYTNLESHTSLFSDLAECLSHASNFLVYMILSASIRRDFFEFLCACLMKIV